jgi:hypothetical protein
MSTEERTRQRNIRRIQGMLKNYINSERKTKLKVTSNYYDEDLDKRFINFDAITSNGKKKLKAVLKGFKSLEDFFDSASDEQILDALKCGMSRVYSNTDDIPDATDWYADLPVGELVTAFIIDDNYETKDGERVNDFKIEKFMVAQAVTNNSLTEDDLFSDDDEEEDEPTITSDADAMAEELNKG